MDFTLGLFTISMQIQNSEEGENSPNSSTPLLPPHTRAIRGMLLTNVILDKAVQVVLLCFGNAIICNAMPKAFLMAAFSKEYERQRRWGWWWRWQCWRRWLRWRLWLEEGRASAFLVFTRSMGPSSTSSSLSSRRVTMHCVMHNAQYAQCMM